MTNLDVMKLTEKRKAILDNMNIFSLEDLVTHYPYRYDIIEETYPLLDDDHIVCEATLISPAQVFFKGRMSRMTFKVEDKNMTEYQVTIFNRHFLRQYMKLMTVMTIIGKCNGNKIVASDIKLKPIIELTGIHPIYSLKEGMTQKVFEQLVSKALELSKNNIISYVPEEYRVKHQLIHKENALHSIHFPSTQEDIKQSLKYLKYEEFLKFQLTMQLIKQQRNLEVGISKQFLIKDLQNFVLSLPYPLTDDQKKSVKEIIEDLRGTKMMYRFLQGDVGSGKTVVSAIALYANYLADYQGALMAPTEILARQHYQTLVSFFKETKVKVALLTGSLSFKEKENLYEELRSGVIHIVVGTHALFQKKVEYANLGFVITDEQHRFGVEQRKALKNKGNQVDFLIMSATPIPRTLAISMYGDMDVSTIKTMPVGRIPIQTHYINSSSMKPILKDLKDYLFKGGQCYVICPLVDESESLNAKSASQIAEAMQIYFKDEYHVGLMHGQMKDENKEAVMKLFKENQIQILVSTTVVEVGVDVKNANMMVIYNAERFGLSQLHQLRGRIGRGNQQAYCYLMSSQTNKEVVERLKYMENNNDGFEISMYDLQMRGPGEVLGSRQSGLPTFLVADIMKDFNILSVARDDAMMILEKYKQNQSYSSLIELIKENLKENNEYVD